MNLDPATADPRSLAEALRRELSVRQVYPATIDCHRAALLAVLDRFDSWRNVTPPPYEWHLAADDAIRTLARAYIAAGGTLPGKVGEGEG